MLITMNSLKWCTPQQAIHLHPHTGKISMGSNETGHILLKPQRKIRILYGYNRSISSGNIYLSENMRKFMTFKPPREMLHQNHQVKMKKKGHAIKKTGYRRSSRMMEQMRQELNRREKNSKEWHMRYAAESNKFHEDILDE